MKAIEYLIVSLVSLLIGVGILLLFIFKAKEILAAGFSENIFYVLLIPMALASAGFLFGGMKSYAKYKGKLLGGILELGGPVVLFCLVLVGGFKLVPDSRPIEFVIYFESVRGDVITLKDGRFFLHLIGNPIEKEIRNQQFVDFGNIPKNYRMQLIEVELRSENWIFGNGKNKIMLELKNDKQNVVLKMKEECLKVTGTVTYKSKPLSNLKVSIDTIHTHTNTDGSFMIKLPEHNVRSVQRLKLYSDSIGVLEREIFPCLDNDLIISL